MGVDISLLDRKVFLQEVYPICNLRFPMRMNRLKTYERRQATGDRI